MIDGNEDPAVKEVIRRLQVANVRYYLDEANQRVSDARYRLPGETEWKPLNQIVAEVEAQIPRKYYYLAGPMGGYPEHNFPLFKEAASYLRAAGNMILSPHEVPENIPGKAEWADCLKRDLALLLRCSAVYVLWGWEQSKGATLELMIASTLGMPVYQLTFSFHRALITNGLVYKEQIHTAFYRLHMMEEAI